MSIYNETIYGQDKYGNTGVFRKVFIYKIYDNNTLVTTWTKEVISEPGFTTVINGGPGQLSIKLDRPFEDYGEGVDVKINNRVDCIVFDREDQDGMLLFRGYISSYSPNLDKGREGIDVIVLPFMAECQRFMLRESDGDTEVPFLSTDPSDIVRGVLQRFQADGGNLNTGTIDDTDTTVSYTFNTNTVKQAFDKCVQLAPENWYWSVDPDSSINFREKPTGVTHDLSIGKHIEFMRPEKRVENVVNRVYFTGGGDPPLYIERESSGSIDTWGLYVKKLVDQRVTVEATAEIIAQGELNEKSSPEVRTKLRIVDSNGQFGTGYDIESIKVGDTIRIKNLEFGTKTNTLWDEAIWDTDVWDFTLASVAGSALLVVKTKYTPNMIEVETASRFPEVSKRIEDINRNLIDSQTSNNPATPAT